MNGRQAIRTAGCIGSFCARHLLALCVTVGALCVIWTATYLGLLLWAIFAGGGIGGPLAYLAGLLFFFLVGTVASLVLLFPSTALAEWFARRRSLSICAQVPMSVAVLALLCLVISGVMAAIGSQPSFRGISVSFGMLFVAHLLPLGIYWWTAQSGPLLLALLRHLFAIFRP